MMYTSSIKDFIMVTTTEKSIKLPMKETQCKFNLRQIVYKDDHISNF